MGNFLDEFFDNDNDKKKPDLKPLREQGGEKSINSNNTEGQLGTNDGGGTLDYLDVENDDDDDDDDDDDARPPSTNVIRIDVVPGSIKPGGLRCFLMLYLMGAQNEPERGTWTVDQPTREEYTIDLFYRDRTAFLTVTLADAEIRVDRVGAVPSVAYTLQETAMLQGILGQLEEIETDETIAPQDRLLILPEPRDGIERARDALAFG